MQKSHCNRLESIPISSLTQEELKDAIKEWAEGSLPLERLLWSCYKNGIKTSVCHSDKSASVVYLDVIIDDESPRELFKCMLSAAEKFENAQVNLTFGGNPVSGAEWHKTHIGIFSRYSLQADRLWETLDVFT